MDPPGMRRTVRNGFSLQRQRESAKFGEQFGPKFATLSNGTCTEGPIFDARLPAGPYRNGIESFEAG